MAISPTACIASLGLFVATSVGCADSHTCDVVHADAYRVEYSTASKDCLSEAQLELPTYVAISYSLAAVMVNTGDSTTSADLKFENCSAIAGIGTQYKRSQLTVTLEAQDLDVHDDGSLDGVASLQVLDGETMMCSASIPIALTPVFQGALRQSSSRP